jgi:hypothetical protein
MAEAQEQFRNAGEMEHPPLETISRGHWSRQQVGKTKYML